MIPYRNIKVAVLTAAISFSAFQPHADTPTFSKDIAPIFFKRCATCHRPGEVAPMSLLSYEETRPWVKSIRKAVAQRVMPPWGANPKVGHFSNDLGLTDAEIKLIGDWADAGAPEGDRAALPAAPELQTGWKLGEPDYVVELGDFQVPADGNDLFPTVRVAVALPEDRWIRAIEFSPGDKRVVHHILAILGDFSMNGTQTFNQQSVAEAMRRTASAEAPEIFQVWVAGAQPTVYPEGMGRILKRDQVITVNLHYHPNGKATTDRSKIGLYFGKGEMQKRITTNFAVNTGFLIPPGAPNHEVKAFHQFDQDSRIISFMPHMHVRGKDMRYELVKPDGQREVLLDVPRYNYNWQWIYYPVEAIRAPKGSRVEVVAHYDNSKNNPNNPDATQTIVYRDATLQEMFVAFMEFIVDDGVAPAPAPPAQKIARLLSAHPSQDAYQANLVFAPFGLYVPQQGEGTLYLLAGSVMFTSTLRDVAWSDAPEGKRFTVNTSIPTPTGGGVSAAISGVVATGGELAGRMELGVEEAKADPQHNQVVSFPFKGHRGPAEISTASESNP